MANRETTQKFKNTKVLLIGDTIVDVYTYCNIVCEAPYAPIYETEKISSQVSFGGNSLVANNMLELGGEVTFISVIGDDAEAKYYDRFTHPKLKKLFFTDKTRKTTVKERWFADGKALLQVNQVDNHDLGKDLEEKIMKAVEREAKKVDVIVVMDPQHGVLTRNIIQKLLTVSKKFNKPLYVDVQVSHRKSRHHLYKGADAFFLNQNEASAVYARFDPSKTTTLLQIARKLNTRRVVVKLGERGSIAYIEGRLIKTPPHPVEAVDVCGAGDAFLAAFSIAQSLSIEELLHRANVWAGLSTTIHGTIPPKRRDLHKALGL